MITPGRDHWCPSFFNKLFFFDGTDDDFGDVFDFHLVFGFDAFDAVLEHGDAEGTGGSKHFGVCFQGFVDTSLVDALAGLFFHPGTTTTTTATEAAVAVTAHFGHVVAVEYPEDTARLLVYVVVTPDVTGIVIGQLALVETCGQF